MTRTRSELYDQIDRATALTIDGVSSVPGMTYEEGVRAALEWAIGDTDELPIEED